MMDDEARLGEFFSAYRAACPEVEPGVNFMPELWRKIEQRRSFWFVFENKARAVAAGAIALTLVLALLNFVFVPGGHSTFSTYMDALMAEHTAEKTYYGEGLHLAGPEIVTSPGMQE